MNVSREQKRYLALIGRLFSIPRIQGAGNNRFARVQSLQPDAQMNLFVAVHIPTNFNLKTIFVRLFIFRTFNLIP